MGCVRVLTAVVAALLLVGCSGGGPAAPTDAQRSEAVASVAELGPDALGLGEPLATASQDVCQEGQQNSKVTEVESACTVGRSWILPAAEGRADVAGAIDALRDRLADRGCESVRKGGLDLAARYWSDGVQEEPGMLPGSTFACGSTEVEVSSVSPAEPRVSPISLVGDLTGGDVGEPDTEAFPSDVEQRVEDSGQVLLWQITVTQQYAVRP